MSCLNLRLPPPAKKAWKSFTSKLQSRLQKLNKFKAIKKPSNRFYVTNTSAKAPISNNLSRIQRKKYIIQPSNKALRFRQHSRYLFKKKAGPVYIDKLFKEPLVAAEIVTRYSPSVKNVKPLDDLEARACGSAADEMWESLALASPQMNGIDQRAEEFIQSFRAEMELQEIMARRL